MKTLCINLISGVIPHKSLRKRVRASLRNYIDKYIYRYLVPRVHARVIERVRKRVSEKKPVKVRIISYHRSHFSFQSIYSLINSDENFDIKVIVAPNVALPMQHSRSEYEKDLDFFSQRGIATIQGFDFENGICFDLESDSPDILIYQSYWPATPDEFHIKHWYNRALCISVPYGYMLANIPDYQFNTEFHNLVWMNCEETVIHKELAKKYCLNQGINAVATGYPKMDDLAAVTPSEKDPTITRILWAPHYSIQSNSEINIGTFDRYCWKLLDFAKQNPNYNFVVKPHPGLRVQCQKCDFMTREEYDDYLMQWESLPNGDVNEDGGYMDLFASSDAMILDSISFISEYAFTGKPLCFISKWTDRNTLLNHFNDFGRMLMQYIYVATDWNSLEQFMMSVRAGSYRTPEGHKEFVDNLMRLNYGRAGKFIVEYVKKEIGMM